MQKPLWKNTGQFLKNINIQLPYNPVIPFLGTYPREMKAYAQAKICMQIFIAVLFIIAKNGKQSKYPSTSK